MIIFLYGEDTFRSRKKLKELKDKFLREVDPLGNSLFVLSGETVSMEKINEAISPSSLLAAKRMTIIENLFANKKETIFKDLLEYLKKKNFGNDIVVFWDDMSGEEKMAKTKNELFKFLSKQKFVGRFLSLSNTETTAWVKKEVEVRGGKISLAASSLMAGLVGSDLWQINNEIDKLISYKAGQKLKISESERGSTIEPEDVIEMVRGKFDEKIFALTDAISQRDKGQASKLLAEQIDGGLTDSYLLAMVERQFKILLQVRQAVDAGLSSRKMISLLKLHPFVVQKSISQARNFSLPILTAMLRRLVEIDYQAKNGRADANASLQLLIAKL